MVGAGLCHTDLLSREWPPEMFPGPIVYGHEGAGIVEAVGSDVSGVAVGDHVVLSFDSCGGCAGVATVGPYACYDFLPLNLAPNRPDGSSSLTDANGRPVGSFFFGQSSLASHAVVAARSVVKVDPSFALERLGPLGCGVQTGAGAILNTLGVDRRCVGCHLRRRVARSERGDGGEGRRCRTDHRRRPSRIPARARRHGTARPTR